MATMHNQTTFDKFQSFMDLPSEIRDLIYSYALCKGRIIIRNGRRAAGFLEPIKHYETNDGFHYLRYKGLEQELLAMNTGQPAPIALGLVQGVSRQVHDEATRIFFGKNQFIFPAGQFHRPSYCNLRDIFGRSSDEEFARDVKNRINNALLFRDVSYTFDMRDQRGDDYANLYRNLDIKESIDSRTLPPGDALQVLHNWKTYELEIDWTERIDSIKRMTLDRLVLAFEECYCAIGCCRKVEWVLDRFLCEGPPPGTEDTELNAFCAFDWASRPPLVIEVMGFVNDEEKVMAREKLSRLPGTEVRLSTTQSGLDELRHGTGPDEHLSQILLQD